MMNATRVVATIVILALAGTLALIGLPSRDAWSPLMGGAMEELDPALYAGFEGTFGAGGRKEGVRTTTPWGKTVRGETWSSFLDVSDDRLDGTMSSEHNYDRFGSDPNGQWGVRAITAAITNEGGSWAGTGRGFQHPLTGGMHYEVVLEGTDGYDGLTALLVLSQDGFSTSFDAEGVIFPGDLPAYPSVGPAAIADTGSAAATTVDPTEYSGFAGDFTVRPGRHGSSQSYPWGTIVTGDEYQELRLDVGEPRLDGAMHTIINSHSFLNGASYGIRAGDNRVENDDGAWQGRSRGFQSPLTGAVHYEVVLTGEGDFEGLTALLILSQDQLGFGFQADGVIFPGELPPYPDQTT